MMIDFDAVFSPTLKQVREKILEQARAEKWCCTCVNFIPVDDSQTPDFVTVYPECKLGGVAIKTCSCYVANEE